MFLNLDYGSKRVEMGSTLGSVALPTLFRRTTRRRKHERKPETRIKYSWVGDTYYMAYFGDFWWATVASRRSRAYYDIETTVMVQILLCCFEEIRAETISALKQLRALNVDVNYC